MTTPTHTITYLSLMRKYGDIKKATTEEARAAARNIPDGSNALTEIFAAARQYETECQQQADRGVHPAVCFDRDGFCDEDSCSCWK